MIGNFTIILLKYLQHRIHESSQLSTDQSREACRVYFIQQCHSLGCSWHKNRIIIMFRASFKVKRTDRTDLSCMARNIRVFSAPGLGPDLTNAFWEIQLRFLLSPGTDSIHPTTLSFESKLKPSRIWVVKRYSKMTTKSFFRNFEFFHPKIQFARARIGVPTSGHSRNTDSALLVVTVGILLRYEPKLWWWNQAFRQPPSVP